MKVQSLLAHHGIKDNPFGQEDAQADQVFKHHCLTGTYHPAWDKIFGSPEDPSTAVVFGEKGSGKTALRLQIIEQVAKYNREHPDARVFVIEYDDFNPFLDCFRERLHGRHRRPERSLETWRLWDHMDAILSLGVTQLVSKLIEPGSKDGSGPFDISPERLPGLSRVQRRDLLLLAAYYDHSLSMPRKQRWGALRRKLRFSTLVAEWDRAVGAVVTAALLGTLVYTGNLAELKGWWPWLLVLFAWAPWLWRNGHLLWHAWRVARQVRVLDHHANTLRQLLSRFQRRETAEQPAPSRDRSDDRYELLNKFQALLRSLGYQGIFVLVDRVDEPHLINGSPDRMRDLLWPMFDNKFLKHPGIGFKLLLPVEVSHFLAREDKEFFERSRLDKQNLIRSLQWTGESLYDVANDRVRACAASGNGKPAFRDLFDKGIADAELIATLERLRVPRHLFKFVYRLLVDHCNRYTDEHPRWEISRETLQSTLALYMRDLQEFDRGMGTG